MNGQVVLTNGSFFLSQRSELVPRLGPQAPDNTHQSGLSLSLSVFCVEVFMLHAEMFTHSFMFHIDVYNEALYIFVFNNYN